MPLCTYTYPLKLLYLEGKTQVISDIFILIYAVPDGAAQSSAADRFLFDKSIDRKERFHNRYNDKAHHKSNEHNKDRLDH